MGEQSSRGVGTGGDNGSCQQQRQEPTGGSDHPVVLDVPSAAIFSLRRARAAQ